MKSKLFIPFLLIVAINGLHQTNNLFLAPYLLSLGISSWLIGVLIGVFRASSLFLIIPSGLLSDRLKIRYLILVGMFCLIGFYVGLQITKTPLLLLFLFILAGAGTSLVIVSTTALFYKLLHQERRVKSLAFLNMGKSLSHGTVNILSGWLITLFSFMFVFKIAAGVLIPLLLLVFLVPAHETYHVPHTTYRQELRQSQVFFLYLFYGLYIFHSGSDSVAAPALWRNFGFSDFQIGLLGGLAVLVVGSLTSLMIGHKFRLSANRTKMLAFWGLLISAAGHVMIAGAQTFELALVGRFMHIAGDIMMDMFLLIELSTLFPQKTIGGHYSFLYLLETLVVTCSIVLAGIAGQFFPFQCYLYFTAGIMFCAALWLLVWRIDFQPAHESSGAKLHIKQ